MGEIFIWIQLNDKKLESKNEARTYVEELMEVFLEGVEKGTIRDEITNLIWKRLEQNMEISALMNDK